MPALQQSLKIEDRYLQLHNSRGGFATSNYVVRPSFPMMTITSSMMMSCLVDPVGAEVANQSNPGL